jgi:hypothetical protein
MTEPANEPAYATETGQSPQPPHDATIPIGSSKIRLLRPNGDLIVEGFVPEFTSTLPPPVIALGRVFVFQGVDESVWEFVLTAPIQLDIEGGIPG